MAPKFFWAFLWKSLTNNVKWHLTHQAAVNNLFSQKGVLARVFVEQSPIHLDVPGVRVQGVDWWADKPPVQVRAVPVTCVVTWLNRHIILIKYRYSNVFGPENGMSSQYAVNGRVWEWDEATQGRLIVSAHKNFISINLSLLTYFLTLFFFFLYVMNFYNIIFDAIC